MTYDDLCELYPDLNAAERHLHERSRMLKRQGEYDRDTFLQDEVHAIVDKLIQPRDQFDQNELARRDTHRRIAYQYYATEYPPYNKHLIAECNIFTSPDGDRLRDQIDEFLNEDVSRLISFQVLPDPELYIVIIAYYPY